MKAYIKNDDPGVFLYPDQMKRILEYLDIHGTLQISAEQVEGYYMMFSDRYDATWLTVNDRYLEWFADYLSQIDVDPAHCFGDTCSL